MAWKVVSGGVTAPKGYRAAGITAGLKSSGLSDLALIVSDVEVITRRWNEQGEAHSNNQLFS